MMSSDLVVVPSSHRFAETLRILISALTRREIHIFAQIDHAANARDAGLTLRPTTVVVFGSGRAGTPLMQAEQTLGLDLPLRALVWEDAEGKSFVAYHAPGQIAVRHGLDQTVFPTIANVAKLLGEIAAEAAGARPAP
jgi:uncharacterized protein (DUF302 family)